MKTLIVGYGSPIRGDDALGPLAADRLAALDLGDGIEVASRHVLTAEMVADLADKALVIFLDAAVDIAPGEVRCQALEPDEHAVSTMAHFLDPRELLAWCETLYQRVPETYLVTGGGDSFDYASYELTPAAEQAIERMLACVGRLLEQGRAASHGQISSSGSHLRA
ncbi:hydrogenase maturation protease [Thiorhodococcus minor]|uniref:Hydrogenase maturation protease n=1 Tax=Thiorhodococcus minor TaxID=57489 RepID=A0A6M0JZI7_9GAMM|nr:hydrogenase maturation protease [Thiorhodococcus minor]